MSDDSASPWPRDVNFNRSSKTLSIQFEDGAVFHLPAEYLRVESPSAEVQGHGAGQKKTIPGKRSVSVKDLEPVGNYAVRILFDDGHDSGLFTWAYLYELGEKQSEKWEAYLSDLARQGMGRD